MSQSFKNRLLQLKETHSYKVEVAKLEFVRGITRLLKLKSITNAELATKIGTSNAYITKALRGDTNFTIDSMVKLASGVGANLHIHIADTSASVKWFEVHPKLNQDAFQDRFMNTEYEASCSTAIQGIQEALNEPRKIYA